MKWRGGAAGLACYTAKALDKVATYYSLDPNVCTYETIYFELGTQSKLKYKWQLWVESR